MADLLATNDVLEVRLISNFRNQYAINVRHFRIGTTLVGAPTLDQAASAFEAKFAPLYKACMSSVAQWYGLTARRVTPGQSLESVTASLRGIGSVAGDPVPSQVAAVISLRSAIPGRAFRGRMYVPFASEADNGTDGRPSAQYIGNANAIAIPLSQSTVYVLGAQQFSAIPVIYHRKLQTETTIVQAFTRFDWGTQRRRSQINRPDRPPIVP